VDWGCDGVHKWALGGLALILNKQKFNFHYKNHRKALKCVA
jgi:hypothetical protein